MHQHTIFLTKQGMLAANAITEEGVFRNSWTDPSENKKRKGFAPGDTLCLSVMNERGEIGFRVLHVSGMDDDQVLHLKRDDNVCASMPAAGTDAWPQDEDDEPVIDVAELRKALDSRPYAHEVQRVFNLELVDRMDAEIGTVPSGLVLAFHLLVDDLQRGKSGLDHRPLPHKLRGLPFGMYAVLGNQAKKDVMAALPEPLRVAVAKAFKDVEG